MLSHKVIIHNLIVSFVITFFILGSLSKCHKEIVDIQRSDNIPTIVEMIQTPEYKESLLAFPEDSAMLSNIYLMTSKTQELALVENVTKEIMVDYEIRIISLRECSKILFGEAGEKLFNRAANDSINTKEKKAIFFNANKIMEFRTIDHNSLSRDKCLEFLSQ